MNNIFLILFYVAGFIYCYGNLTNNELITSIGLYSIIPSIGVHYIINNKKSINFLYIIALLASYTGVIFYYINDIRVNVFALAGFSLFNLSIMLIVFEKMNVINFRKVIPLALVLIIFFLLITYKIFGFFDFRFFAVGIYFTSLSLLISFCLVFTLDSKTKVSYYFLVGVLSYIITSVSTEFLYLNKLPILMTILNTVSYVLTHYTYYKAITQEEQKS